MNYTSGDHDKKYCRRLGVVVIHLKWKPINMYLGGYNDRKKIAVIPKSVVILPPDLVRGGDPLHLNMFMYTYIYKS